MSTADNICKSISEANNEGVCDVNNMLQNMSTADNKEDTSVCANCGKEGDDINNVCNKCKQVKYCNAACKKKHRHKHKKDCEEHIRLAAEKNNNELRRVAEKHDEDLFKQPPPKEDCPICFLRIPSLTSGWKYQLCCGSVICSGCVYAPVYDNQGNEVDDDKQNECPFCRFVAPKSVEEMNNMLMKRSETGDAITIFHQGNYYRDGRHGLPQDYKKALELYHRAGELGYAGAYCNIGNAYHRGRGVEVDKKVASYYFELAAMAGDVYARHNLGTNEALAGNMDRAIKHWMIAVRDGYADSLTLIKETYSRGYATKDDYTAALQLYQTYLGEIKSVHRDKAATADERNRYY